MIANRSRTARYREDLLRKRADPPTIKILDIWRSVSTQVIGRPLEVVVENRPKTPQLPSVDGELNVARPAGYQGQVVLSVWLESFPDYKPLMLTHEVGHWILIFRGFRGFVRQPRNSDAEVLLNSMVDHPPLYALQKSIGHDPKSEIDSRCDHDIRLCSQPHKEDALASALYIADDLLNCPWKKRRELEWAVRTYRPRIMEIVTRITKMAADFDLSDPLTNLAFRKKLVKKLKIQGRWFGTDDVRTTRELILEVEGKASSKVNLPTFYRQKYLPHF